MRTCTRKGCTAPVKARDLCSRHYVRRRIDLDEAAVAKFWLRVDKTGPLGCWLWIGSLTNYGYGVLHHLGGRLPAHRVSFEIHNGPIPADVVTDHICRTRRCVNPAHLRLLSNVDNVMIGISPPATNARRAACARGHVYDEANTRVNANGWRDCRACDRERARRYWGQRRERLGPSRYISRDGTCVIEGCDRARSRRGMCGMHYARMLRAGK